MDGVSGFMNLIHLHFAAFPRNRYAVIHVLLFFSYNAETPTV